MSGTHRSPSRDSRRSQSPVSSIGSSTSQNSLGRIFDIASEEDIKASAFELSELVMRSSDMPSSIGHAVGLLYDSGTSDIEYSRTISLITEELYLQIQAQDDASSDLYLEVMEKLAVQMFRRAWLAVTDPELYRSEISEHLNTIPSIGQLMCASAFLADLYAVGILSLEMFCQSTHFVVDNFTENEHLICLLVLFSRANTYMGERMPTAFYLEIIADIRHICRAITGHETEEQSIVIEFIRDLLRDACDDNSTESLYCEIPYHHFINADLHCADMICREGSDVERLYQLHDAAIDDTLRSPTSSTSSLELQLPGEQAYQTPERLSLKCESRAGSSASSDGSLSDLDIDFNESNTFRLCLRPSLDQGGCCLQARRKCSPGLGDDYGLALIFDSPSHDKLEPSIEIFQPTPTRPFSNNVLMDMIKRYGAWSP